MSDKKKDEKLQFKSVETENKHKKILHLEDQKTLLLLLRMRRNFAQSSLLAKKIKKNIASFKTLKNK